MRFEKLTTKSQEAIREASDRAARKGNPELLPEHFFLAALEQEEGVARPLLVKAGLSIELFEKAPEDSGGP